MIGTIVIGFCAGLLAKWLHPGKEDMGFIMTILLGIGGSFAATYVGKALGLYESGQAAGFISSVIGAIVLLTLYGMVVRKT